MLLFDIMTNILHTAASFYLYSNATCNYICIIPLISISLSELVLLHYTVDYVTIKTNLISVKIVIYYRSLAHVFLRIAEHLPGHYLSFYYFFLNNLKFKRIHYTHCVLCYLIKMLRFSFYFLAVIR